MTAINSDDLWRAWTEINKLTPSNTSREVADVISKRDLGLEADALRNVVAAVSPLPNTPGEAFAIGVIVGVRAEKDKHRASESG